jgi:hypothetical protein
MRQWISYALQGCKVSEVIDIPYAQSHARSRAVGQTLHIFDLHVHNPGFECVASFGKRTTSLRLPVVEHQALLRSSCT